MNILYGKEYLDSNHLVGHTLAQEETLMHLISQGLTLVACVAVVYIFSRGLISVLHQLTVAMIRRIDANEVQGEESKESKESSDRSTDALIRRKLVVLAELCSEGEVERQELKVLADELLEEMRG